MTVQLPETITKLPLATWGDMVGIHPLHLHGITTAEIQNGPFSCGTVWSKSEWQKTDAVSRDEVMRAIRSAEDDIEDLLGHHLIPTWNANEPIRLPRPYKPEYVYFGVLNSRRYRYGFNAHWGWFLEAGIRAKTLIDLPVNPTPIVWDAPDADSGWSKWGTITVTSTVTQPEEIRIYYPGHNGEDEYEIRPIKVSITAGIVTIRVRRELCVLESLEESMMPFTSPIDGSNDANFTGSVDVYRVYNDPSVNAQLIWETIPGCDTCGSQYTQTGAITVRDYQPSLLAWSPANYVDGVWYNTDLCTGRAPDMLRAYYKSGYVSPTATRYTDMDPNLARAVMMLSIARLHRPPCGCMQEAFTWWQQDLTVSGGGTTQSYRLTDDDLGNPLGTRRGAIDAWRIISRFPARNLQRSGVIA